MRYARAARALLLVAGALGLTATPAAAATVTHALNLRSGPGLGHRIVTAMPAGASVDMGRCSGSWCRVKWRSHEGWASARYLSGGETMSPREARRERRRERQREARNDREERDAWRDRRFYDPWDRYDPWYGWRYRRYGWYGGYPWGWGWRPGW